MVICLERGADLHVAQLIPLPLIVSCFSKIQTGFTFLVLDHQGSPGQRAVKRVCCNCGNYLRHKVSQLRVSLSEMCNSQGCRGDVISIPIPTAESRAAEEMEFLSPPHTHTHGDPHTHGRVQGCRGDGISIPIPIPWGSPYPRQTWQQQIIEAANHINLTQCSQSQPIQQN